MDFRKDRLDSMISSAIKS